MTIVIAGGRAKRIRRARADGMAPPPHWRCPDCGQPCHCSADILAFKLPHVRCGLRNPIQ